MRDESSRIFTHKVRKFVNLAKLAGISGSKLLRPRRLSWHMFACARLGDWFQTIQRVEVSRILTGSLTWWSCPPTLGFCRLDCCRKNSWRNERQWRGSEGTVALILGVMVAIDGTRAQTHSIVSLVNLFKEFGMAPLRLHPLHVLRACERARLTKTTKTIEIVIVLSTHKVCRFVRFPSQGGMAWGSKAFRSRVLCRHMRCWMSWMSSDWDFDASSRELNAWTRATRTSKSTRSARPRSLEWCHAAQTHIVAWY